MTEFLLEPLVAAPSRAGLFLDFDGVLADITADPGAAVPRDGVPRVLDRLAAWLGRVAVVSGRPVSYVGRFIPVGVDVVGLYGLEWRSSGTYHSLPEAEEWREPIAALSAAATVRFGEAIVEPKGLSLTIHYRNDPDLAGPIRGWASDQADQAGLELRPAKHSYELHPPLHRDKGTVVLDLAHALDAVAYLGDDLGDLPAFDALDELARRGVTTVRVAVDSSEVPPVLVRRADLGVEGPAGAEALLRELLERLSARSID